jgi:iron complex transport system ATP-binding protein
MAAVLELRGVAAALGSSHVLRHIDLRLGAGEVLGLLGRNGAGKTTLLRVATRVLRPDAGEALLNGRPLEAYSRRELARAMAVVPQETAVPFAFRALEVVLMGRAPHLGLLGFETGQDLARAAQALDRVGIAHLAERPVTLLSGGERQLVVLARALAQDSPILLLDEPTAFLDLRHRLEVLSLVRELARAGRSALVVSHDLGLAARFCDRLALLGDGEILAQGPPPEVLTPANLRRAFEIESEVVIGPEGVPLVVPRLARPC